jgi:uncharacterized protein
VSDTTLDRPVHASTTIGTAPAAPPGYGPLAPVTRHDPLDGVPLTLLLPEGFDFAHFGAAGTELDDGHATPRGHDGAGCFRGPGGTYRIVRNHRGSGGAVGRVGRALERYDPQGAGGTTTVELRWGDGAPEVSGAWTSLAGTVGNRGGGATPWGSWLSCEASVWTDTSPAHGWVFEVPSQLDRAADPRPLVALGRFAHDGAAVDPRTGTVYLTEAGPFGGIYRLVPARPGDLTCGGRLEMLAVRNRPGLDTRTGQQPGRPLAVRWVPVTDVEGAGPAGLRRQGLAAGGATFTDLAGCWWDGDALVVTSATGGEDGAGQVWEHRPLAADNGLLKLVAQPAGHVHDLGDVTGTWCGALVVCARTGAAPVLVGVPRHGAAFPFCLHDGDGTFAGATFSPDGHLLVANLRSAEPTVGHRTVAVRGPWERGPL